MGEFIARLKGENEVPPVNTEAFGIAKFVTNTRRGQIRFFLQVKDIRNLVQAHIHFGARGQNGPVLVFLFGADLATLEEQNGLTTKRGTVTGIITNEDIVSNDIGVRNVNDLIELMCEGLTYVNVHTEQNPEGEIRGQIKRVRKNPFLS
ncbi:CHRD domain-containing protein [Pseudalkalibacillus salsuginis]|uniref:CHRD domain-containing protein n=1 Tax=Pseudalkalibacillus salsuginis TaxID=2910972 RepID=UPI001F483955|nr:CHRD domain-containing protein [Pseudalkalibacillus salsuginis]MCF6408803.1 CHRD domain-containing protein [Pseudalkalibacillus salsuginis]